MALPMTLAESILVSYGGGALPGPTPSLVGRTSLPLRARNLPGGSCRPPTRQARPYIPLLRLVPPPSKNPFPRKSVFHPKPAPPDLGRKKIRPRAAARPAPPIQNNPRRSAGRYRARLLAAVHSRGGSRGTGI